MAKKKKSDKKKDAVESYSLDNALKSSKKTETDLQGLLKGFSETKSYVSSEPQKERIAPQLSHETKKKIAEAYALEDIPLTERPKLKEKSEKPQGEKKDEKITEAIKTGEEKTKEDKISEEKPKDSPPIEEPVEKIVPGSVKEPSFSQKDNIYEKLGVFFEDVYQGYTTRYDRWENSVSSILTILRKMRKITKKNTEDLVGSINNMHIKIQDSLEQFKMKRQEVEKIAGIDVESMSSEFKKVLGLLELQVKEYQLKKLTDEYIHLYNLIS